MGVVFLLGNLSGYEYSLCNLCRNGELSILTGAFKIRALGVRDIILP